MYDKYISESIIWQVNIHYNIWIIKNDVNINKIGIIYINWSQFFYFNNIYYFRGPKGWD